MVNICRANVFIYLFLFFIFFENEANVFIDILSIDNYLFPYIEKTSLIVYKLSITNLTQKISH